MRKLLAFSKYVDKTPLGMRLVEHDVKNISSRYRDNIYAK